MHCIITTCRNRREHLEQAARSWRFMLPGWLPILCAVDDPEAVALVDRIYGTEAHLSVSTSQRVFSRLAAISAAVEALPVEAENVALFDADVVALLHTRQWLSGDFSSAFQFAGPSESGDFNRDDFGVLVTSASVLRTAFELISEVVPIWDGYGWEDCLIRCACWVVCDSGGGRLRPAAWAHIPHSDELRMATVPTFESIAAQAGRNYRRLLASLDVLSQYMAVPWRESSMWRECIPWCEPT